MFAGTSVFGVERSQQDVGVVSRAPAVVQCDSSSSSSVAI